MIEWYAVIARHVRASHDAQCDITAFDVAQGEGVLLTTEEALGSVDGVECPEGGRGAVVIAGVDGIEHLVFGDIGQDRSHGVGDGGADGPHLGTSKDTGMFFTDDVHGLVERLEIQGDDGLHCEVSDGDRASIVLGDFPDAVEVLLYRPGDAHGVGNGSDRGQEAWIVEIGVGHGFIFFCTRAGCKPREVVERGGVRGKGSGARDWWSSWVLWSKNTTTPCSGLRGVVGTVTAGASRV